MPALWRTISGGLIRLPPGQIGESCPQCARIKKGSAPTRTAHHTSQMANSQVSRSIGAPRPKDQNLRLPQEAVADHLVRPSMGKVSPYEYGSPALSDRPQSPGGFPLPLGHSLTRVVHCVGQGLALQWRHACPHPPTAENHLWRDARFRRARPVDLLLRFSLQPFVRDQRRSMVR
jgi:hypothetical protein